MNRKLEPQLVLAEKAFCLLENIVKLRLFYSKLASLSATIAAKQHEKRGLGAKLARNGLPSRLSYYVHTSQKESAKLAQFFFKKVCVISWNYFTALSLKLLNKMDVNSSVICDWRNRSVLQEGFSRANDTSKNRSQSIGGLMLASNTSDNKPYVTSNVS